MSDEFWKEWAIFYEKLYSHRRDMADGLFEIAEFWKERSFSLEDKNKKLREEIKEWEKHIPFLHSQGFFRDRNL